MQELAQTLYRKNGFFAFEAALRVFPTKTTEMSYGVFEWNSDILWKSYYGDLTDGCFFFGEDAFGGQFCIAKERVYAFDPEAGEFNDIAGSIEKWAECILEDYNYLTGYPLMHEWQEIHGALSLRDRLMPRVPFVFGGEYTLENLTAVEAAKSMRIRGPIAQKIRNRPDGTSISLSDLIY